MGGLAESHQAGLAGNGRNLDSLSICLSIHPTIHIHSPFNTFTYSSKSNESNYRVPTGCPLAICVVDSNLLRTGYLPASALCAR